MRGFAERYPQEQLAQFPDFLADWQKVQQQQAVESSSITEQLGRGFSRGVLGLEASGAGALALTSDLVGAQGAKDFYLDIYKRKQKQLAEEAPASVPTIQQATQSLPAAGQYLAGKVGELVPNIGEALVFAGAGTLAAPGPGTEAGAAAGFFGRAAARSALKSVVEKTLTAAERKELEDFAAGKVIEEGLSPAVANVVKDASSHLASIGTSAANFAALGAGGAYGELSGQEGVTPEGARTGALIAGAGASIGALIPERIIKGIFGEKAATDAVRTWIDSKAVTVPKELLIAGGGMGAMEFFNILGERYADPKKRDTDFTKDEWSRLLNATAVGILAGTPAAAIAALRRTPEGKPPPAEAPAAETEPPAPPAGAETTPPPPPAPPAPAAAEPFPTAPVPKTQEAIMESRRLLLEAQRQAAAEMRQESKQVEVPATPAEERTSVLEEIRKNEAKTVREIQELFPKSELSREQARELRNAAWGAPDTHVAETYGKVTAEQKLVLLEIANKEVSGTLTDADREYVQQLPVGQQEQYKLIREGVEDATQKRTQQKGVQPERVGDNAQLQKAEEDRVKQAEQQKEGAQAGAGDSLRQAAGGLDPTAKAALKSAGIDVDALTTGIQSLPPGTDVDSLKQQGWIEAWRQDRSDAPEEGFRKGSHFGTYEQAIAIRNREIEAGRKPGRLRHVLLRIGNAFETTDEGGWEKEIEKARKIDPTHDALVYENEGEKVGGKSYVPFSVDQVREIGDVTPVDEAVARARAKALSEKPAAERKVEPKAAPVVEKPAAPAPVETGAAPWLEKVPEAYNAWQPVIAGKEEINLFGRPGASAIEKEGNSYEVTNSLGVFQRPDGKIVVGTLKQTGKPRVNRVQANATSAKSYEALIKEGWKPLGAIRTGDVKQAKVFHEYTADEWAKLQPQLEAKATAGREAVREVAPASKGEVIEAGLKEEGGIPSDAGRGRITRSDAEVIHDLVITEKGLPPPDDVAEMVSDAIVTSPELQARLRNISGQSKDAFGRLMDRIFEVYERAAASGETDPGKLRTRIIGDLEGIAPEKAKGRAQSHQAPPDDVQAGDEGELEEGAGGTEEERLSRPQPSREPGRPEFQEVAQHVIQRLNAAGIPVNVVQGNARELVNGIAQSMGSYDRARKTVNWSLSDLSRPNGQDMRILFEEAAHALFDREGPEVQEPILRAMAGMEKASAEDLALVKADIANAYPEGVRPEVYNEELMAGWLTRKLQSEGFNPLQARGIGQSIVRLLKDIYLKAAMWLQRTFLGEQYSNPDLALRYFQNRLEGFLAGNDALPSWIDALGGPKPTHDVAVQSHLPVNGDRALIQTYNPVTTQVDTAHLIEDSVEAALLNTRGDDMRYSIPAPGAPPPRYVDPSVQLNRDVAVNNEVRELHDRVAGIAGVTRDAFRKLFGLTNTDRIAAVKAVAAQEKQAAAFNPGQRLANFANEQNIGPGYMEAIRRINGEFGKLGKTLAKDKETKEKLDAQIPTILRDAERELDRYTDAQFMDDLIKKGVRKLTVEDIRREIQTSRALGTITQIGRELEGRMDQPVSPGFINALRKLHQGPELQGTRLFDLLDYMANDPAVDFSKSATEIRQQLLAQIQASEAGGLPGPDAYYRISQDTPESRALLATVLAYGKTNRRVMAQLEMRRMASGQERVELEQKLKDLWKETRQQIDTGIRSVAKSAKLEERARAGYREVLGRVMTAKRNLENTEHRISVAEQAMPAYKESLDRLDPKIKRAVDTEFQDGMTVRVPKTMEIRPGEWESVKVNLNIAKGPITDLMPLAEKLAAWTKIREEAAKHGDETALNLDYQTARQQLLSIFNNRFFQHALRNTDQTTTGLVLGAAPKKLRSIGTPSSDALAGALSKFVSDTQVIRNQADVEFGYRNARFENKVLGVLNAGTSWYQSKKVSVAWFDTYVKNAAFGFMEKMQFSEGGNKEAELNDAYQKLGTWLLSQDHIRPLIQDRMAEFMPALRDYIESVYESGQFFQRKNEQAGLLVKEPKLGGQLRAAFQQGMRTFQRKFSALYTNMVHAMRASGWALARDDFKNARQLYHDDPAALQAIITKYFDHETHGDTVRNDFWYKLTHVPDESPFESTPVDESGVTFPVDPTIVAHAYDQAGGDVIRTIELMFEYQHGSGDVGQYVQDTLLSLSDQFGAANSALNKVEPRSATEVSSFVGLIPDAMIDARQFPHWPSEWFDFHKFDRNDNARMAERIAGQINFGRDTKTLANLHQTLTDETKNLTSKLRDVLARAERNVPSGRAKDIDAGAEKILANDKTPALQVFKTGRERLQYLRRVEERAPFVQGFLREFTDYYQRGSDQNGSLNWGIRFAQAISGLLVNNPASAISQLATTFDIPVQWGSSPTMLKASKRTIQLTAKDIAGGLAQGIGWSFMNLAPYEERFLKMKLNDPEVKRRFGDIMAVQEGEQENPMARRFRIAKEVQSFTLNLRGEAAKYTPIRPLAPFYQTVFNANRALTVSLWELADTYVQKGVKYLQAHPGSGEISAETLGLKGLEKDSFERWKADAARYGFRYTDAVKGAKDRIESGDKTLLTDQDLSRLYSLGLAEISLEPSIATMPLAAFNNSVLRFVLPLLGWSYRRALQVAEKVGGIDPNDKRNLKSVGTAVLGLATTGLGGLGLSLAVDAYQEDVVGKKRNIRALRFPTSGADWVAIQERLNRIGTVGLWGELINGAVNVGTGQGDNRMLSVDQRVVALQSFQAIQQAISAFINQSFDPDYQHVVRPMIAALGGNGMLQYMQVVNHAFDLDNVENRVVKRINAENYLRVTGRDLGMSIRTGGGGYNTPTPITPWIARMEYAAYANDPMEFREMYQGAIAEAKKSGKPDPADYVKRAFETRHPLRYVFSQTPSERDYREILGNLDDTGREAVSDAVRLFNYYGAHLGLAPFAGSKKKDVQRAANPAAASRARELALGY